MRSIYKRDLLPDVSISGLVLILYFLIAPFSLFLTIASTAMLILIFIYQVRIAPTVRLQTRVVYVWTSTSFLFFQLIFILTAGPIIDVTLEEVLVSLPVLVFVFICFWITKRRDDDFYRYYYNSVGHNCLWLNCYIDSKNFDSYVLGMLAGIINVFYVSNVLLKYLCQPYMYVGGVIIPQNCSQVYSSYGFALLFITALYLMTIGVGLACILTTQFLMTALQRIRRSKIRRRTIDSISRSSVI